MLHLRSFNRFVLISLALLGVSHNSSAATIDVAAGTIAGTGQLTHAKNINVGGTLYDVEFVDGTCITVFSGCDSVLYFAFGSESTAKVAAQNLADQVFGGAFDGSIYDSDPGMVNGIEITGGGAIHYTPYALDGADRVLVSRSINFFGASLNDGLGTTETSSWLKNIDLTGRSNITYLNWTPSPVSAVPVPAAVWLFGTALVGLIGFGKRRKAA